MSSWLIIGGTVGAILCVVSLLMLGIMFANEKQWWHAAGCLIGIAVIVFAAILGDMYANDWWEK